MLKNKDVWYLGGVLLNRFSKRINDLPLEKQVEFFLIMDSVMDAHLKVLEKAA